MKPLMVRTGTAFAVLASAAVFAADNPPPQTPSSVYIDARGLRGAKTAVREKDRFDKFEYLRSLDANGISFTVTPKETGDWVVMVRVRVGAAVPMDHEAALVTLYGTDSKKLASVQVSGSPGDDCWQVLSLGQWKLEAGMRVEVLPGTKNAPRFLDLRNIVLVRPEIMSSNVPAEGKDKK